MFGHSDAPTDDARVAMELAEQAVALDEEFARAHSALGTAYTAMGRHEEAVIAAKRAIELQPGDADSHAFYGRCLTWAGLVEEANEEIQTALRLDPRYIEGPYLNMLGRMHFVAGQYEASIEAFERNHARGGPRGGSSVLLYWVASLGLLGRAEAAQALAPELLKVVPDFSLTRIGEMPETHCVGEIEPLIDGLRKAGLPE